MELIVNDYILKDVEDKQQVVKDIITHVGHEFFESSGIARAMGAYDKTGKLCGYFLTCSFLGVRSFHGFKFIKNEIPTQLKMMKTYLDMEDLKYSGYRTKQAGAVLKLLGFKEVFHTNGITVAKRE